MLDIYVHEYLRTFVFKQVTYFIRHSGGIKVWKIYLIRWTMLLRPLDFSTYRRAIFNSPEVKKKNREFEGASFKRTHSIESDNIFHKSNSNFDTVKLRNEKKKRKRREKEKEFENYRIHSVERPFENRSELAIATGFDRSSRRNQTAARCLSTNTKI